MCVFTIQGIAVTYAMSGFNVINDHRYGVATAANHEEPQPWNTAT